MVIYEENGKAPEEHDYLGRYVVMSHDVNNASYRVHNDVIIVLCINRLQNTHCNEVIDEQGYIVSF